MSALQDDKTRMMMVVAVVLWLSAAVMLFLAMRLRMRPILLLVGLDALLALLLTTLAIRAVRRGGDRGNGRG